MGELRILEVDEERIPKERPPVLLPVPPGKSGPLMITRSKATRFQVFGRARNYAPRDVSALCKVVPEEEKKALFIPPSEGRLWKIEEDDPETVYRTWNYARLARGRVLVLGVKLGLFPRLAIRAQSIDIVTNDSMLVRLVLDTIRESCGGRAHLVLDDPLARLNRRDLRYDFVYVDLGISRLTEANRIIGLVRPVVSSGGVIALKGHQAMIQAFQSRCQALIPLIATTRGQEFRNLVEPMAPEDLLFVAWAFQNSKRVFKDLDYRFVNAWSRMMALKVTE